MKCFPLSKKSISLEIQINIKSSKPVMSMLKAECLLTQNIIYYKTVTLLVSMSPDIKIWLRIELFIIFMFNYNLVFFLTKM